MPESQILRINNQGDIPSLHPPTGIDLICRNFQKALFEGLTRIGPDGSPQLAAAQEVKISDSKLRYTFTLRPMKWTNGEEVTAFDFEKTWKAAMAPNSNCLLSNLFYPIKNAEKAKKGEISLDEVGIKALDAKTLVIDLEHQAPYFLDLISNSIFSPLYDNSATPTIFNGPFLLAKWDHDATLILEKNPHYWDAQTVRLKKIIVSLVDDPTAATLMYDKGELDWIGRPFTILPQDILNKAQESTNFTSHPIAAVYWLSVNTKEPHLNSIKIRQALSTVLNREEIAKYVIQGETPTKTLLPISMTQLGHEEIYPDNNIALAKQLFDEGLQELGLTHSEFPPIRLAHNTIPGQKTLAETIKQKWEDNLGIKVELSASEWNVFHANLSNKQYQVAGCVWFSLFNDPIYYLDFFKSEGLRYNAPGWENAHYKELLELADQEADTRIRSEHLKQAERLILEEMPIIPLYMVHAKYLKSPKVQDLFVNNLGHVDFKWAHIKELVPNVSR